MSKRLQEIITNLGVLSHELDVQRKALQSLAKEISGAEKRTPSPAPKQKKATKKKAHRESGRPWIGAGFATRQAWREAKWYQDGKKPSVVASEKRVAAQKSVEAEVEEENNSGDKPVDHDGNTILF